MSFAQGTLLANLDRTMGSVEYKAALGWRLPGFRSTGGLGLSNKTNLTTRNPGVPLDPDSGLTDSVAERMETAIVDATDAATLLSNMNQRPRGSPSNSSGLCRRLRARGHEEESSAEEYLTEPTFPNRLLVFVPQDRSATRRTQRRVFVAPFFPRLTRVTALVEYYLRRNRVARESHEKTWRKKHKDVRFLLL